MMKRSLVFLLAMLMVLPAWTITQAAPPQQQVAAPQITAFTSTATRVDTVQLANRTARIPVSWTTSNRPPTANLVFEQLLPDGRIMNVELPRQDPVVPSQGVGVVAPFPPGGDATSVTFRVSLIDTIQGTLYDKKEITLPIGQTPAPTPTITAFTASATSVNRAALTNRSVRIPVSWQVDNRPDGSNLVFEQVLEDGSSINVELPRQNPFVASSGNGVVNPAAPQKADTKTITLRLRLVNLTTNINITTKDITVAVDDTPAPTATITAFTANATGVNRTQLVNRTARIPVSWQVDNRPDGSNLVFEQVLEDGSSVNVELPRQNPFVTSSGNGMAAPVATKTPTTTTITLRLRLVNLSNNSTITQKDITLPISEGAVVPVIRTFTTTATNVNRNQLANRSARVPVSWAVDNRPQNSNLVFEQVLANGAVINVELPRQNPLVSSAGDGVAAPALPGGTATTIELRLRLIDLTTNATLAQQSITLPLSDVAPAVSIRAFTSSATSVDLPGLTNRTARIPVSWIVDNRPDGSNLVFEQVLDDNSVVNVELPRQNPFVSSSGNGVAAPVAPKQTTTATITLRLRVINLADGATLAQTTLNIGIAGRTASGTGSTNTNPGTGSTSGLSISSFSASPTQAERGGAVTLSWASNAAKVSIVRLNEIGGGEAETIAQDQPASGSFTYTLPGTYLNNAGFTLVASATDGQETRQNITVAVACPFSDTVLEACPYTQDFEVNSSFQSFEKGVMVWRGDLLKIYVLYNDGTWQEYDDTWTAADADPTDQAPDGLFVPTHGFGKLWTQLGGSATLGWATAQEISYVAQWETYPLADGGQEAYTPHFTLPDGRIAHLGMTWSID